MGRAPAIRRTSQGFTLLELAITMAMIAILMLAAVTSFGKSVRLSRERSVPERFLADFLWARTAATAANANTLISSLTGAPTVVLTLSADCSWRTTINATADASHSMSSSQISNQGISLSCSGLTLPATFTFDNVGGVSTTGNLTFTGSTNTWPMAIFASGSVLKTKVAS